MPRRIMKRMLVLGGVLLMGLAGTASAKPPCSAKACETMLTATHSPKTWKVKGEVGEKFLLYLNVYEGGKRLPYKRLPGNCAAAYSSSDAAVVLHACGKTSSLRYVALDGHHRLRVIYRYEPR